MSRLRSTGQRARLPRIGASAGRRMPFCLLAAAPAAIFDTSPRDLKRSDEISTGIFEILPLLRRSPFSEVRGTGVVWRAAAAYGVADEATGAGSVFTPTPGDS